MEEISNVRSLLEEPLKKEGYELVEVKISRDKSGVLLQIVVDRDLPISLEDIVKVSDLINPLLDQNDPIKSAYTLDVSSLGAEKPIKLENLDKYVSRYVNLHLSHPYEGKNILEGSLSEVNDDTLTLLVKEKTKKRSIVIERKYVDKARLAIEF